MNEEASDALIWDSNEKLFLNLKLGTKSVTAVLPKHHLS